MGVGEGVGQWDTMSKYFGLLSSILCHSKALNRTKFNPPPFPLGGGGGWGVNMNCLKVSNRKIEKSVRVHFWTLYYLAATDSGGGGVLGCVILG